MAFAWVRRIGAFAVAIVLAAFVGVAIPTQASAETAITGVDLSTYARVGRFDLPEPTHTPPRPAACWRRKPPR